MAASASLGLRLCKSSPAVVSTDLAQASVETSLARWSRVVLIWAWRSEETAESLSNICDLTTRARAK
jgi:hypothetical protein